MTFPVLVVEIGFGAYGNSTAFAFNDAERGLFNTGTFADVGYTDVSSYVLNRAVSVSRGKSRSLDAFRPGTCSFSLDNSDDRFNPNNLSGPYVSGGATQVLPMAPVRITLTDGSGNDVSVYGDVYRNTIFTGYVDSWTVAFDLAGNSVVEVHASDAFKVLASYVIPEAGAEGASESTGARIGRLLNAAEITAVDRVLDTGAGTVPATTFGQSALSEIQQVELAELGAFFIDADGKSRFISRTGLVQSVTAGALAVFSQDDFGFAYRAVGLAYDDTTMVNSATATRNGGSTAQTATDSASIAKFLTKNRTESSLWVEADLDAARWAQQLVDWNAGAELRVDWIEFQPDASDGWALFDVPELVASNLELMDPVQVDYQPEGGDAISRTLFIAGITHTIAATSWTVRITTTDAEAYLDGIEFGASPGTAPTGYGFNGTRFVFTY